MDLNGDGIDDLVSGSYAGEISMYAGVGGSQYAAPVEVAQATDLEDYSNFWTFGFTNPTFVDMNGDGLLDALVGGLMGVRVMYNEGTDQSPMLAERVDVLNVKGEQVKTYSSLVEEGFESSDYKVFANLLDWDNDGVKDLITAISYYSYGHEPVLFHKGVNTAEGLRFEEPVALFKQEGEIKVLPGTNLVPHFCDYNNDGLIDMLLGVTMNYNETDGEIDLERAYKFEVSREAATLLKNASNISKLSRLEPSNEKLKEESKQAYDKYTHYLNSVDKSDVKTFRNRGYVMVFPGVK